MKRLRTLLGLCTAYLKYLEYVIRHKYYVGFQCFKYGLYWQGVVHDLSKFLPSEATPYMRYFTLGDESDTAKQELNVAWNAHQKRNKHHWQYWLLFQDNGGIICLEMPKRYVLEMLCDWWGVGRAFADTKQKEEAYKQSERAEVIGRYTKNKHEMKLHPDTKSFVEDFLGNKKRVL